MAEIEGLTPVTIDKLVREIANSLNIPYGDASLLLKTQDLNLAIPIPVSSLPKATSGQTYWQANTGLASGTNGDYLTRTIASGKTKGFVQLILVQNGSGVGENHALKIDGTAIFQWTLAASTGQSFWFFAVPLQYTSSVALNEPSINNKSAVMIGWEEP